MSYNDFDTLLVSKSGRPGVLHVQLNRPNKRNAMNALFWAEFRTCFERVAEDTGVRSVVISGVGDHLSAGLDLTDMSEMNAIIKGTNDVARRAVRFRKLALSMQESFTAVERCPQPVVAAVHGSCVGAGVDMICACDIRLCSSDAVFSIAEVKVGLAADVGTLQRMPKIVGNTSLCRELAFTGRTFGADEAERMGLVSRVCQGGNGADPGGKSDRDMVVGVALDLAAEIALQSPVAVFGTKRNLTYSLDHGVSDGLEYAATWSGAALQTEDIQELWEGRLGS
ncbi:unnamed protein product, partial [Discosporangium mesarthrocarpum]